MNTQERLARIRAKCVELLEIASKRTEGKWGLGHMPRDIYGPDGRPVASTAYPHTAYPRDQRVGINNSAFIAACAGNFEQSLRSTIAAIDRHARMAEIMANIVIPSMADLAIKHELHQQACDILAAWPEDCL